jgi:hypothetical protein
LRLLPWPQEPRSSPRRPAGPTFPPVCGRYPSFLPAEALHRTFRTVSPLLNLSRSAVIRAIASSAWVAGVLLALSACAPDPPDPGLSPTSRIHWVMNPQVIDIIGRHS